MFIKALRLFFKNEEWEYIRLMSECECKQTKFRRKIISLIIISKFSFRGDIESK